MTPPPAASRHGNASQPQHRPTRPERQTGSRTGRRTGLRVRWGEEDGRVTAFVVILAAAALLMAGLVLDGGTALAAKIRAAGQAQEAARAGAQAIDLSTYRATGTLRLDLARADALARAYLEHADAAGATDVLVSVAADTVTVTITTAQPTRLLGLIGIDSITVTGTGAAHPDRGPADPPPPGGAPPGGAP
jgi:hypothetical protein